MPKHLRRCRTHSLNLNCYAAALRSANGCQQLHISPLWICTKTLEAFSSRNRIVPSIDGCWMWRHISKKDYSITMFPKMSKVFEFCCQKSAKFVAKRICRVLIVPSFTLAAVKSQWDEKASHCFTPIQAPSHPVPLSPIQAPSTVPSRPLRQSHPGSIMEQFLEWGRTSPWAMAIITLLGLASSLRIAFGLLKNLRDLIWAYVLPRIWPVDLVKTYGKWVHNLDNFHNLSERPDILIQTIRWWPNLT